MATHSSVLAWRFPGTGKPGGLPSMGSHRVGHDWSDLAAAAAAYTKKCTHVYTHINTRGALERCSLLEELGGMHNRVSWIIHRVISVSSVQFSTFQSLSRVRLIATPWIAARQASLCITISRSSLQLTSIESVMPSSHLILGCPLLLLPPIPPSISLFQWVNPSQITSKEIPGLISFSIDWLDLLVVQGFVICILSF